MKLPKHWTPRYFKDRFLLEIFYRTNLKSPWLTKEATKILDSRLKPTDLILEFGSGRSTVWFAKRVKKVTSVESNHVWIKKVQRILERDGLLSKVEIWHIKRTKDYPNKLKIEDYSQYDKLFEQIDFQSIDCCLVDGGDRDYLAISSLEKIKIGGMLVIDNINWWWPRKIILSPKSRTLENGFATRLWKELSEKLKEWECIWTTNGVTDTAFWIKNK